MAAGGGFFTVAGVAAALILFALVLLIYVENLFNLKPRFMLFRISTTAAEDLVPEVHKIFSDLHIVLDNFQVSMAQQ